MLIIKRGIGLFTSEKILQGTVIFTLDVNYSRLGPIHDDFFGRHMRHHTRPNCKVQGYSVIGLRTISANEELTLPIQAPSLTTG